MKNDDEEVLRKDFWKWLQEQNQEKENENV